MDKSILIQINSIRAEIKDLKKRLNESIKPVETVTDSVQGSSREYPYTKHNCIIQGLDERRIILNKKNRNKYNKQIKIKEYKLEKLINKLEYELNYIDSSDIRRIIRHRYEDELNWVQIMFKMGYDSESKARMKLERFLNDLQP